MLKRLQLVLLTPLLVATAIQAKPNQETMLEIEALIQTVADSSCIFHRNGSSHDAESAAEHLRLKLSNGAKYVNTSEQFIERLASKSSWTNRTYTIECEARP
ncbi:hypothetical protein DBZ36_01880 [Alginatibacterium sediminis]|uniref:Uncharacterized protein n=1 Tax=Alginatibacterium sediminis TaxID=2164068 RepID=A0A420EL26_9ALTE|nr:DUF5329 family protein [Alginatibacterium sediminis]RKF21422.1 hypothetical protein DBZ36_01880 [Alginatibacterium sediminis]